MSDSQAEELRQKRLAKQREEEIRRREEHRAQISKESEVRIGRDKFTSVKGGVEQSLKHSTVGLVKLEDFQRIRGAIEEQQQREAARTALKDKSGKRKGRGKGKASAMLSFGDDEEGGDGEEEEAKREEEARRERKQQEEAEEEEKRAKKAKISKNPDVDTSFLPDREREAKDRHIREELRQEWLIKQEKMKQEPIQITYSYWDGNGHRAEVQCKKGDSIVQFLEKCRNQHRELRGQGVDNLMYIKEDLIIPHHYTFYDFIINKARGKSGPLFSFDVHEDVRLVNDARVEKDESHAGKVLERTWYERNKHIFPASRWEVYDPKKDYGSYSIKDRSLGK
ncbi:FAM50A protein [Piptocephalis cylindrospora]|uniref:FAM50A protein n=1 Tax=Piptocephalis cylindrospora TaxID=1907219 RepID=A0A4P9Y2E1_9FUNG|nr:FAM50A protein [Piptocephalis cylindrospora]|eukprot:RKP12997.1 FAM50A protein [Piptocephalis cylindrospora]